MVKYSYRALYMKYRQGSWIELCNNDCGTEVYFDKENNIVCNAAAVDKDCVHKDVCNELKKLKVIARALNWYPSFAIDPYLVNLFKAYDAIVKAQEDLQYEQENIMIIIEKLKRVLNDQQEQNKQAKVQWDKEKSIKLDAKKITDKAYGREQDQIKQWKDYEQKEAQFRTADRLQHTK